MSGSKRYLRYLGLVQVELKKKGVEKGEEKESAEDVSVYDGVGKGSYGGAMG